jgi:tRNA(adenine34) deaminase
MLSDNFFMQIAYQEALKAFDQGEVPVGAVIVCQEQIIAKAHNTCEQLHDVTAHAEMLSITAASDYLSSKYLNECTMYITLEPCAMCAGALAWAQLQRIVYAASDSKRGFSKIEQKILHPKTIVNKGLMEKECLELMTSFFQKLR